MEGSGQVVSVIPQVAMGVFDSANGLQYKTTIQITNAGSSMAIASAEFFNADGTPFKVPLNTSIDRVPAFTGSLNNFVLPPHTTVIFTAGDSSAGAAIGWGRITSSRHVTVATFFDISDSTTGTFHSRLWLPPSTTDLSRFAIPRVRSVTNGADTGFAIVNTGSSPASFTSTLIDSRGVILGSRTITLAPGQQLSAFAAGYFGLADESAKTFQSFIVFDSTEAQFAAVGIAFDGNAFLSFPVDRIP
jgi:hypothetical protein